MFLIRLFCLFLFKNNCIFSRDSVLIYLLTYLLINYLTVILAHRNQQKQLPSLNVFMYERQDSGKMAVGPMTYTKTRSISLQKNSASQAGYERMNNCNVQLSFDVLLLMCILLQFDPTGGDFICTLRARYGPTRKKEVRGKNKPHPSLKKE